MERRRFQTLVLLASNVLLPLLGLFSADWDPTAMLASTGCSSSRSSIFQRTRD